MSQPTAIKEAIARLTEDSNADLLFCNSGMDRGVEAEVVNLCRKRDKRDDVILFLITSGGDADVAFRIARYLQGAYKNFTCIIPGWCKSAGTLLSLGANEIAFGVHGELGPLDVQMAKKDELLGSESGLTVMTALTAIHEKTLLAFEHFFLETTIKGGGRLTVQTASEIATSLAKGLFAPICEQIDPIHIGEAWRSMAIATEYARRLSDKSRNVKRGALDKVIGEYPSHSFVIDLTEAQSLFENVRKCTENEQSMIDTLGDSCLYPQTNIAIFFLNEEKKEILDAAEHSSNEGEGHDITASEAGSDAASADGMEPIAEAGEATG